MRHRSEEGFTLVELIMAVTITGIIGSAVTASIIIGLRTTDATANRLADSRDAQLAAAYFGTDVQAADVVNIPSSPPCGSTVTEPAILELVDQLPDSTKVAVFYATESTPTGTNLRRIVCEADNVTRDVVVAADLLQTNPPVATCDPHPCGVKPPTQVKLTVSVRGCSASESTCREGIDSSPYQYELLGTTRSG